MRSRGLAVAVVCVVLVGMSATGASARSERSRPATRLSSPVACPGCWHPGLKVSWQWQLANPPKASALLDVKMYDVDGFDASAALIAAMHSTRHQGGLLHQRGLVGGLAPGCRRLPPVGARQVERMARGEVARYPRPRHPGPDHAGAPGSLRAQGLRRGRVRQRRRISEPDRLPALGQGPAPLRRVPGQPGAHAGDVGVPEERHRPGGDLAAVLRRGVERAVLPVRGVRQARSRSSRPASPSSTSSTSWMSPSSARRPTRRTSTRSRSGSRWTRGVGPAAAPSPPSTRAAWDSPVLRRQLEVAHR